ncbi:hypothetical protein AVEN_102130-1 [Araneus ventricosus]|uniref:Uncharacterized protein n=1 Tax=Araneus ventricosus TaxID=182803 RepID=A0A4Y2VKM9_ARAVE|nr:hypothetical protein AVEN_102130-1 [Araneus ventricosus]
MVDRISSSSEKCLLRTATVTGRVSEFGSAVGLNGIIQDKRRGNQYEKEIICSFSEVLMSVKSLFPLHSRFGAMGSCPVCLGLAPPLIPISLKLDIHHQSNPLGGLLSRPVPFSARKI